MSASLWPAVGSLAAVASVVTAAFAAWQSRQAAAGANEAARRASVAADRSADAADTLAAIERERFHRELTPVFKVRVEAGYRHPDIAYLFVLLIGGPLDELESVRVTIRDLAKPDRDHLPEGVTEAQAERAIWAGWRFSTFDDSAESPRRSHPRRYSRVHGEDYESLVLVRTVSPRWYWHKMNQKQWEERWRDLPLRLRIDCHAGGTALPPVYPNPKVHYLNQDGDDDGGGELSLEEE